MTENGARSSFNVPEIRLPRALAHLRITSRHGHVRQVYIAFCCIPAPAKHTIDGLRELVRVMLVDAAGVDPEVVKAVASGLLAAEHDLPATGLTSAVVMFQIRVGDLVSPTSMQEYGVGRDRIWGGLLAGEVAAFVHR